MIAKYSRTGGWRPPLDREVIVLEEQGAFFMWRSISSASQPPTAIGHFSGNLDQSNFQEITSLIQAAFGEGELALKPKPDAAIERINLISVRGQLGAYDEVPGHWGELIGRFRQMLGELTQYPEAALDIEIDDSGRSAHLFRLGPGKLEIQANPMTIRAVLWDSYTKVGDWSSVIDSEEPGDNLATGSGFEKKFDLDHGFSFSEGQELELYVKLILFDDDTPVPSLLVSKRFKL